jgi:hypothetical protein
MAIRRAIQFPGAMPEEIAFARQRRTVRRASLRVDGTFALALAISFVLILAPALIGWSVGRIGGVTGMAMAVLAGSVVSVLLTFLAARAYVRFSKSDRLFPDATISGWLRRARAERSIAQARELFSDPNVAPIELHVEKLIKMAKALEARDARTHKHSNRVALHAVAAGEELGLSKNELIRLRATAKLHALGPDLIEFTGDREMISALRHQEEHFDGSGGPDGLRGERIPLMSRIIAVANEYDSVARAQNQAAGFAALQDGEGTRFDPIVVEAFVAAAQASPATALRGAFVGAFPRAAQGAADLLRGSAGVVAAASIATTAVVAGGGIAAPPHKHHSHHAGTVQAATVTGLFSGNSSGGSGSHSSTGHNRAVAHVKGTVPDTARGGSKDSSNPQSHNGTTDASKGGDATSASPSADNPTSSEKAAEKQSPSSTPVQDIADDVGQTVDNTTQTVGGVVDNVTGTVNDTVDNTTKTVGGVVGGLTGNK